MRMGGSYIGRDREKESYSISIGVGAVVLDFMIPGLQWESLTLRLINESATWVSGTMFLPPPKDGALLGGIRDSAMAEDQDGVFSKNPH